MNKLLRLTARCNYCYTHLILLVFFLGTVPLSAQNTTLRGTIVSTSGDPIEGASIQGKGTLLGTFSDQLGYFSIQLPDSVKVMVVQFLGFETQEVSIRGQSKFTVELSPSTSTLDEVVVVGFGTQQQRQLTTAISTLRHEAIEGVSVPVFQRALQGQLPGVVMTNASGGLNAESIIRIRGVGSISAGNQPLFVVDGLILAARPGGSLGYSTNPLIGLNPNDIASVEVLRDAAAAAIYGARGSNGVILISTKSGQFNTSPKVQLGYYAGFSEISKRHELLDGRQYAELWNEAAVNAGFSREEDSDLFYDPDEQPKVNWQELLLQRGFVQESHAELQGGSQQTRYYIGASMREEDSYLRTVGIRRYAFRGNLEQRVNEQLKVGLLFNPSRTIDNRTGNQWAGAAWGAAAWFQPNVEALDGNGNCRRDPILGFPGNPCVMLEDQQISGVTTHVLSNLYAEWKAIPHLLFRTELGVESYDLDQQFRFKPSSWFGAPEGRAGFNNSKIFNYNWTNTVNWHVLKKRKYQMSVLGGVQMGKERYQDLGAEVAGFADNRINTLGAAASLTEVFSERSEAAFVGYFTRAQFGFWNKYLLTVSARYDGSSRFGSTRRYGFFPAVSAGWVLSEEPRLGDSSINLFKVRSSIGSTGNAAIGDDSYRGLVDFNSTYNGGNGYSIQSLENDDLSWERNVQWDLGVDIGVWNNRLRFSLDYYIKDTYDLLLERPVAATNGISSLISNIGAVRNQGLEGDMAASLSSGKLNWTIRFNFATLNNRVLRLVDNNGDGKDDDLILNNRMLFRPGASIGSFFLVKYAGVDESNGDALFYDLEGKKIQEALAINRQIVGNSLPCFSGGLTNQWQYKGLDLTLFFQFKTGFSIYWESSQESNMSDSGNQRITQLNAWRPDNRVTNVPQARLFQSNGTQASTRYLHRGDFLRLQHLNLGYTLPDQWVKGTTIRLFAAGQNLFTWTKFPGLDPDSEFYAPSSAALGAIRNNLPAARTFTFGCKLSFH